MNIWFASGNKNKKKELSAILRTELKIPVDVGMEFDPEETGSSFHENALLKARELYRMLSARCPTGFKKGDPVIADDSGLCVDALGGRPGIYSALYAGSAVAFDNEKKLTGAQRNALLLEELGANTVRSARFVCAMVLLISEDRFYIAQETMEGIIVASPQFAKGSGGFGYDPVLYIPESGCTVAEMPDEEKNRISHRGKAGKIIADIIRELNGNL